MAKETTKGAATEGDGKTGGGDVAAKLDALSEKFDKLTDRLEAVERRKVAAELSDNDDAAERADGDAATLQRKLADARAELDELHAAKAEADAESEADDDDDAAKGDGLDSLRAAGIPV